MLQDHLTCGLYYSPHNVDEGGRDITFSLKVLPHIPWPHRDITVGKYKAGFHEAWAYRGCESMWDMPGNKRPSLNLRPGQEDLFQQPQIALCFLNWQTPSTFDKNDMQLAGWPALQVDHLSAGKLSSIKFIKKLDGGLSACVINYAVVGLPGLNLRGKRLQSTWSTFQSFQNVWFTQLFKVLYFEHFYG